jgi:hypothetical protein
MTAGCYRNLMILQEKGTVQKPVPQIQFLPYMFYIPRQGGISILQGKIQGNPTEVIFVWIFPQPVIDFFLPIPVCGIENCPASRLVRRKTKIPFARADFNPVERGGMPAPLGVGTEWYPLFITPGKV